MKIQSILNLYLFFLSLHIHWALYYHRDTIPRSRLSLREKKSNTKTFSVRIRISYGTERRYTQSEPLVRSRALLRNMKYLFINLKYTNNNNIITK